MVDYFLKCVNRYIVCTLDDLYGAADEDSPVTVTCGFDSHLETNVSMICKYLFRAFWIVTINIENICFY